MGFTLQEMKFNSQEYWKNRYAKGGHSGLGSYGDLAKYKADFINDFIKARDVKTLIEYGCGDGNQLSMLRGLDEITAIDVSQDALDRCLNVHWRTGINVITALNATKDDINVTADMALSLDVIYHLVEDEVYNDYMQRLCNMAENFLIIYSPNYEYEEIGFAEHVKPRKFTDHPALNEFELIYHEPNKYPSTDHRTGSFSEFRVFQRKN